MRTTKEPEEIVRSTTGLALDLLRAEERAADRRLPLWRRAVRLLLPLLLFGGGVIGVATPALAVDGNLYNCPGSPLNANPGTLNTHYYCLWDASPHVNYRTFMILDVYNMGDCTWWYVPDTKWGHVASQANASGYWLQAFGGNDQGSYAIIYSHTAGAMSAYWHYLSAVRRIPAGRTTC